jgi:hypothetical protein
MIKKAEINIANASARRLSWGGMKKCIYLNFKSKTTF